MTKEGDKPPEKGGKILVIRADDSDLTEEEVTMLVVDAGVSDADIEFVDPETDIDEIEFSDEDCIIVPLEDATADDKRVERLVLKAAQAACSIIGVWAPGENDQTIHPAVAKYGAAQIPWDSKKLRDALDQKCPEAFESPEGDQSHPHKKRYNKCG
jgi:hypothetical protein